MCGRKRVRMSVVMCGKVCYVMLVDARGQGLEGKGGGGDGRRLGVR